MARQYISQLGRPLTDSSLYRLICKRTRLATSTAVHHGAEIGLAMTVLDHKSSEVTECYYNQAKMIDAEEEIMIRAVIYARYSSDNQRDASIIGSIG